ncbi:MAG: tripartite tricarboxylate transporter substrate binding protein BugD [Pseudorhodoplanes sp.]|nr:MAG: tripartite tricarboxylate transporter substrate binding protein BugD [Pseudorhodoplanes sp.]
MRNLLPAMALAIAVSAAHAALAQTYPTRPVTLVIPFAGGGPTDLLGRIVAGRMSEILGQQVVVENVGGEGGEAGAKRVADAAPDGYAIVMGTVGTHAQSQTLYKTPRYNALTDFTPVALLAEVPIVLIARRDLPVEDLKSFAAHVKENESKMTFGSAGAGSASHLACVVANAALGLKVAHAPYQGTGPATEDLQGGRIDYLCEIAATAGPALDSGSVKGIAVMAPRRSRVLPALPTAMEQGVAGIDAYTWNAIFLPKGAPEAVVRTLADAVDKALETPAIKERLTEHGWIVVPKDRRTPAFLASFLKTEIEKWAGPITASGATVE